MATVREATAMAADMAAVTEVRAAEIADLAATIADTAVTVDRAAATEVLAVTIADRVETEDLAAEIADRAAEALLDAAEDLRIIHVRINLHRKEAVINDIPKKS